MTAAQNQNLSVLLLVHALPPLEHSGTPAIAHDYARHLTARELRVGVLYGGGGHATVAPLRSATVRLRGR